MSTKLSGSLILIAENEVIICMNLQAIVEKHGAQTICAYSLQESLAAVATNKLSAAVVDHDLGDGDSSELCARLHERRIPSVCSSAYTRSAGPRANAKNLDSRRS